MEEEEVREEELVLDLDSDTVVEAAEQRVVEVEVVESVEELEAESIENAVKDRDKVEVRGVILDFGFEVVVKFVGGRILELNDSRLSLMLNEEQLKLE